ncbi:MAG TPA: D-glycero-beta-D-manno-heptose-7-phosphate kinase, partial [Cyanobacteria bacterium UBA11368]|nr:D-glycero-beta-D-manno-heptose-7-phosphate kinase [Cyanobacteria bacterium UBA11368]
MTLDPYFVAQLRSCCDRLFDILDRFDQLRVLVVGDLTLDEFLTGQ